jgi:D-lactate dehydrogenase (cytochrome)
MCQDFRASPARSARIRAVTRPGLDLVRRPAPPAAFFEAVRRQLGADAVLTDPAELIPYEIDAGQDRATPDGVVFPRSAADLAGVVRIANQHRIVLVPRAAGTSLSGGPIAAVGGVVVAFSRMARVRGVDEVARQATVEPCVINLDLQARLSPQKLFYPPDPASQRASTIGGNISENAGGPHCFKYGVTTSYVQALELVLPSGEAARAGGPAVDYPEYDLVGLFTGSEGTMAFITGATVRVVRAPPAAVVMMAVFGSLGAASAGVSEIIARGLVPAALEMMDRPITRAIEDYVHAGLPDAEVVLLAEVDGYAVSLEEQAAVLRGICEAHGATEVRLAFGQVERERLWFARKSAAGAIARLAPAYYLQDGTVPRSRLGEVMARVEEVGRAHGLSICNVFHAGDGNLHPLILFDPEDAGQASKVIAASREILEKCIEVGGNITGEHGVGIEKILEMGMQFTPGEIQVMREVKQVFDPEDRCNPGKILPALPLDPAEWAPRGAEPAAGSAPAASLIQADVWFEPESTGQVAALLRRRQADRAPIDVVGSGTKLHLTRRVNDVVLSLRHMDRVVEYAPQDLYVRVQAGMRLRELQQLAARDGLWWPVPHPWPDATVGGIVASGWNGPARWRLGAIRDLVLGGVVVLADGRNLRVGGKVVKNVAGYDLTKLHVGAQGTLGVLCELNLKLAAVPPAHRSIAACAATVPDGVASALRSFQESLVASSILVFGGDRSGMPLPADGGATVVVTAAGHPADVGEELRILGGVLGMTDALDTQGETIWSQWQRRAASRDRVLLRIGVPNGRLADVVSHSALEGSDFVADATAGVVWASCPAGLDVGAFAELRQTARASAGYVTVLGAPPAVLEHIDSGGHQPDLAPWMERLRRRWDPAGILNPGRFPFARLVLSENTGILGGSRP